MTPTPNRITVTVVFGCEVPLKTSVVSFVTKSPEAPVSLSIAVKTGAGGPSSVASDVTMFGTGGAAMPSPRKNPGCGGWL
jgi:hypothetical protein